jgi:S-adenosylmethionine:tRNA ribosyltransferase-isomerase
VDYFNEDDVMVFNNSTVFPAVLRGKKEKTEADIEVFLLRELNPEQKLWDVLVNPARKIRIGNKLYFDEGLVAEVIDNTTSRGRTIRFLYDGSYESFRELLDKLGEIPLPPYINRKPEKIDIERHSHPFAKVRGSIVMPSAAMHFSKLTLKKLEVIGVKFTEITLHAGLGNFRDIEVEDLNKHKIDAEELLITEEAAKVINEAKDNKKQICAVGTTVVKALESSTTTTNHVEPFEGWTNKFIFPPYQVKIPTMLLSNFHMPKTPMLMIVAAFGGYKLIMDAYELAVKEGYKFGAYGDAMLIVD